MARVPPSSADFTPAWLKFNNTSKKTDKSSAAPSSLQSSGLHNKSGVGKLSHASTRTGSPIRNLSSSGLSVDSSYQPGSRTLVRHHSIDSDKSWPGVEGHTDEKDQWPNSSKPLHKWSVSTVYNGRSAHHQHSDYVVNGKLSPARTTALDAEFPTLGNDRSKTRLPAHNSVANQPNNMWSKPLVLKPNDDDSHVGSATKSGSNKSTQSTSSIYRNLVPKSSAGFAKQPYRRTVSVPIGMPHKDVKSSTTIAKKVSAPASSYLPKGRESPKAQALTLPTSEDVNIIPAVKRHRKGKNVFLKELRLDDDMEIVPKQDNDADELKEADIPPCREVESPGDVVDVSDSAVSEQDVEMKSEETNVTKELVNVFTPPDDISEDKDWWDDINNMWNEPDAPKNELNVPPLSSSLEAEHRLLREMGWTQDDDGADGNAAANDALTDAEIREFFMRNKRKGLLVVPSPSHRVNAFRNALSAWSSSGPPVIRRLTPEEKIVEESGVDIEDALTDCSSSDISQLSFSDLDSNVISD